MATFWLNGLIFLNINVLMVTSNSEFCASVFKAQVDHILVDHVMNASTVVDEFECHHKCLRNNSCKSFNVRPGADIAKRLCELNNKTRKMTPESFKKMIGSSYYGPVKVSCQDLPTNKKKQTGHCHPDYKGKRREIPRRGWNSKQPAFSCKSIRDSGDSKGDGRYWIDPENSGNPLKVYCDIATDKGGWLLVSNIVIGSSPPSQLPVKTSYRGITSDQMVLTKTAMSELKSNLSFTQLRFHCSKKNGRTFHVTTADNITGETVVKYFSGQTNVKPASCGSFVRMENDNSQLAGVCQTWGWNHTAKWGAGFDQARLYDHPAWVYKSYHWTLDHRRYGQAKRWECDDYLVGVTTGDFWKIYVR